MTDAPTPLRLLRQADPDVLELLSRLLVEAERGEVVSIAVAVVRDGRTTETSHVCQAEDDGIRLLGALVHLEHRIHLKLDTHGT